MKQKVWIVLLSALLLMLMPATTFAEEQPDPALYQVSSAEEMSEAFAKIKAADAKEATIVLAADVTVPGSESYLSQFGVAGKHITVKSAENKSFELKFNGRGILEGDSTFDTVKVTGTKLYCSGHRTIFTKNSEIKLSQTLYGGGYKTDVDSTYVVLAGNGEINIASTNGLHNVIGGSYQANVTGDSYLEISGNIQFRGGNHITPGCVMGDGTSGDNQNSPDVSVGGNATLIYDNANAATSPAIEGSYGCEMKGDVKLDIRSGRANEICGMQEFPEKSIIRGNLHIIAGAEKYQNTDRTLRMSSNWPIVGAGNLFARSPFNKGTYEIDGNVTIDTYENLWGWDKNGTVPGDVPEIFGAIESNVGGTITINARGSHMENITGACDSAVKGDVVINATGVELKNSYYKTEYDEGDIYGLYEYNKESTTEGTVKINVDGGSVGLILATDQSSVNEGSRITVKGSPEIRTGVLGTAARSMSDNVFPTVDLHGCQAEIPFVQAASQVDLTDGSNVTVHEMELDQGLSIKEGSRLTTDENQIHIWGDVSIDGTWEQTHSQTDDYNDIYVKGTTRVGVKGSLINHGTSNLKGDVTNNGMMALLQPALFQGDYSAKDGELRLPAVTDNYDGTEDGADIPLAIQGQSSGTTTVNTVKGDDWQTLQIPKLKDNYILSKKNDNAPAQEVFLLGNEDALAKDYYLKRVKDADGTDDYYMWQVAKDFYATITPMDLTVYVGGEGYEGVIGSDDKFATNDMPEMGFFVTLPEEILAKLGDAKADELSDRLVMTYDDGNGVTRAWKFELYGNASHSTITRPDGTKAFVYKILPSKVDGTAQTVPLRMQFTSSDGTVTVDSQFPIHANDQFRNYKVDFFSGSLDEKLVRVKLEADGETVTLPVKLGTGSLKVRGNTDEAYSQIGEDVLKPDASKPDLVLAAAAQKNTSYYINGGNVIVSDPSSVKLLVDHSFDDQFLKNYLDRKHNTDGKFTYEFRYLDLVDTENGNAYVTMGKDQKMHLYWPVPSDAKEGTDFHIVHFSALNRDSNENMNELLEQQPAEELSCKAVTIGGRKYIAFDTESFSPFALLYEKNPQAEQDPSKDPGTSGDPEKPGASGGGNPSTDGGQQHSTVSSQTETGDSARPVVWMMFAMISAGAALMLILNARRKIRK